ncbi:uncharacterized protein B0H64DRAFT_59445 [Chaetomium fimeti]|uniref:NAD(P)-binding domain-containing protein n=1 Tax=Chaetomium fimeti TaxID=1854472 RepID=A0AAE0H5Q8_9PEZI|nr:hypothetical protein B0H64DRAFT_59445 [Chaetomium fimeti]
MHITVVPASPKTAQAAIRVLLADPSHPTVRGYYRDLAKVPAEFKAHACFEAVQGDVDDGATLDFSDSDAVFHITPPFFGNSSPVEHARRVSENVKAATKKASVQRLVLVSSMGAQYDHGTGEILSNHEAEVVLGDAAPEVVFVRCGFFMENWGMGLETLAAGFLHTTLTPLDHPLQMIAVKDIGATCAAEVLATGTPLPGSSPYAFDLQGPRPYTSADVHKIFEEVTGKSIELRLVEKEALDDFYAAVFPPVVAAYYAEMNKSYLPGAILHVDPQPTGATKYGTTELREVVEQLVGA